MKRQQTPDANKWQAVLNDPSTPEELKSSCRAKLGLQAEPAAGFEYDARLDSVIQSYWGTRPALDPEAAPRDPAAERVQHAIAAMLVLGGCPDSLEDDSRILLNAYLECKSPWMRTHAGRALESALFFNAKALPLELRDRIEAALDETPRTQI